MSAVYSSGYSGSRFKIPSACSYPLAVFLCRVYLYLCTFQPELERPRAHYYPPDLRLLPLLCLGVCSEAGKEQLRQRRQQQQ